jgi:transmembrane sensor
VRAGAGYGVHVDQWTPLVPRPVDVVTALSWERQRIFFDGTPVEQAIGEFNRRNKRQIPIPSYDGENYRIFGEFDLGDPDGFAEHLERTMPRRGSK